MVVETQRQPVGRGRGFFVRTVIWALLLSFGFLRRAQRYGRAARKAMSR